MPDRYDPAGIAADLRACRQRGLDRLDLNSRNQAPVHAGELGRLAEAFAAVTGSTDTDRVAQIKALLIAGIDTLRGQDRRQEADLIGDLFFGQSVNGPISSPGELLRIARRKAADMTDPRFDEWRGNALRSLAYVLIAKVTVLAPVIAEPNRNEGHDDVPIIGRAGDTAHFVRLLASAEKVTIVGITNEDLLPMLEEALREKRASSGSQDAFWDSIRIVFLSMDLLNTVSDERLRLSNPAEALRQRTVAAYWARRCIEVFLKRTGSTKWALYVSHYQPVLTGTFVEFPDGRRMAHLLLRRPLHSREEQTYLDIPDPRGQIREVFEEIVYTSQSATMVVPTGEPMADSAFRCYGSQVQSEVLQDSSRADGWLPMILVITSRHYRGHVEPILQLRTKENSAREENRLAHIAGHIEEDDRLSPGGRTPSHPPSVIDLRHEVPMCAAQRIVRQMSGAEATDHLMPVMASGYLYPDKENLFFFVYSLSLPEGLQFPQRAEMLPVGLDRLLAVRANQSFKSAADLCRTDMSAADWVAAARIAELNLILHDRADLGRRFAALPRRATAERAELADALDGLARVMTAPSRASTSREVRLVGLAGWQYRHFFSDLLHIYADIGVDGAADLEAALRTDPLKGAALRDLSELYEDERLMSSLPMDL